MPSRFAILCILSLVFLSGCATPKVHRVSEYGGESRLKAGDVVDIRFEGAPASEPMVLMDRATPESIDSRLVWEQVFIGRDGCPAVLHVNKTLFKVELVGLAVANRYTYTIDATVFVGGEQRAIHASGTRAAGMEMKSAMRQAVELGVVDCANKAREVVRMLSEANKI